MHISKFSGWVWLGLFVIPVIVSRYCLGAVIFVGKNDAVRSEIFEEGGSDWDNLRVYAYFLVAVKS